MTKHETRFSDAAEEQRFLDLVHESVGAISLAVKDVVIRFSQHQDIDVQLAELIAGAKSHLLKNHEGWNRVHHSFSAWAENETTHFATDVLLAMLAR